MNAKKPAVKWPWCETSWKLRLQLALICAMCVLALGCSMLGTRRIAAEPAPRLPEALLELLNPLPRFSPASLQPCPENLPEARSDDVQTLTRNHNDGAAIYHDCKERQHGLALEAQERDRLDAERIERARKAMGWTR